ncbi:MAG: hypothetical protein V4812_20670 [Pseudomonadota bacterium]
MEDLNVKEFSRIAIVYDFGSLDFFPLSIACLKKEVEIEYRKKITTNTDFQLLWNPEEFPIYATAELQIRVSGDLEDFVQKQIESGGGYERDIRSSINFACARLNHEYESSPFFFSTDPELADVKDNLISIGNIPDAFVKAVPDWF